ncbi:hypothetical protein BY996DRAFT_6439503 [Phakopsora pachyrhizi]|nr:hypothetical protein BY996DRAFT_6439503 [Phakopsora pachyrhizi]
MRPSYSTIVTRMNESSGSVVVVPAAVSQKQYQVRINPELGEKGFEEGPDKGTDQKSSTPCWKRRRGGWLNSPLLLSKPKEMAELRFQIAGNIIGDSDKAVIAIQEWCPADQGKEWRQLLKGEGEEDNWRLVDPFDVCHSESRLLMGKDKYELIGQGGVEKGVDDGPSWDESGRIEASPLGQVWAGSCVLLRPKGHDGVVGSLLRLEAGLISGTPGCGESLRMRRRLIKGKRKMIVTCC